MALSPKISDAEWYERNVLNLRTTHIFFKLRSEEEGIFSNGRQNLCKNTRCYGVIFPDT
jgi:hypothetical protein